MRAALYTRVACASQQLKQAIVFQLETLREYAASHGMEIIGEFIDEGYSGLRLDRPGMGRMRGLAERRGFDVLLTCGPDRLARSFPLQVFIIKELERYGIRTIFLDRAQADEALSTLQEITIGAAEFEQSKVADSDTHGNGQISTASHVEIGGSEGALIRKIFDVRSCPPAHKSNGSVDAASQGGGQRGFHSSERGVE